MFIFIARWASKPTALWPTAFRPPLYPLVLSVLHWFPEHRYYGEGILHVLLGVTTVWAVWRLALAWNGATLAEARPACGSRLGRCGSRCLFDYPRHR